MIGCILFVLFVCLFVCLSIVNFNIRYNFWTIRDRYFIFGMHTPLMRPCQWPCGFDFDLKAEKNIFLDFVASEGKVFHKHILIFDILFLLPDTFVHYFFMNSPLELAVGDRSL